MKIKKNGTQTKFKIRPCLLAKALSLAAPLKPLAFCRCSRYLYTLIMTDKTKVRKHHVHVRLYGAQAEKLKQSLPPGRLL